MTARLFLTALLLAPAPAAPVPKAAAPVHGPVDEHPRVRVTGVAVFADGDDRKPVDLVEGVTPLADEWSPEKVKKDPRKATKTWTADKEGLEGKTLRLSGSYTGLVFHSTADRIIVTVGYSHDLRKSPAPREITREFAATLSEPDERSEGTWSVDVPATVTKDGVEYAWLRPGKTAWLCVDRHAFATLTPDPETKREWRGVHAVRVGVRLPAP